MNVKINTEWRFPEVTFNLKKNINYFRFFLLILIGMGIGSVSLAEEKTSSPEKEQKSHGILPIPAIFYTPETGLAVGGGVIVYYRPHSELGKNVKPSTLQPVLIYTEKEQTVFVFGGSHYFDQQNYHLTLATRYSLFPDKFFGIGPYSSRDDEESFTPITSSSEVSIGKKMFFDGTYVGVLHSYSKYKITELKEDGVISHLNMPGTKSMTSSGLGVYISHDTRDNNFSASTGQFFRVQGIFYAPNTGSETKFQNVSLDARSYHSIDIFEQNIVIAFMGYSKSLSGDVPFMELTQIGGGKLLRGVYAGRYRDKNGALIQTEIRHPLTRKLRGAIFAGSGQVASEINQYQFRNFNQSGGFGLRYLMNEIEKICLRFDVGFTKEEKNIYFQLNEAF